MNELKAQDLECLRGDYLLFEALSVSLRAGEVLYVEGPNGAGKTTLLRMLAGLSLPEAGEVLWNGEPIRRCREQYNAELVYIGHQPGIKAGLSVRENLRLAPRLRGDIEAAVEHLGIGIKLDEPVHTLSAGQRRRVALCRLMLQPGALWILDEPYTALDRRGIEVVEALIAQHVAADGMVVLTSHQPPTLAGVDVRRVALGAA